MIEQIEMFMCSFFWPQVFQVQELKLKQLDAIATTQVKEITSEMDEMDEAITT